MIGAAAPTARASGKTPSTPQSAQNKLPQHFRLISIADCAARRAHSFWLNQLIAARQSARQGDYASQK